MPGFFKSRNSDGASEPFLLKFARKPAHSRPIYGQSRINPDAQTSHPSAQQATSPGSATAASPVAELTRLSERLKALQAETEAITDGIKRGRAASTPNSSQRGSQFPLSPAFEPSSHDNIDTYSDEFLGTAGSASASDIDSGIATSPATQADLEAMLEQGRKARARSATFLSDTSDTTLRTPASAEANFTDPIFHTDAAGLSTDTWMQPNDADVGAPYASTRPMSPLPGMSRAFYERLTVERSHPSPRTYQQVAAFNSGADPFLTPAMSPPDPLKEFGIPAAGPGAAEHTPYHAEQQAESGQGRSRKAGRDAAGKNTQAHCRSDSIPSMANGWTGRASQSASRSHPPPHPNMSHQTRMYSFHPSNPHQRNQAGVYNYARGMRRASDVPVNGGIRAFQHNQAYQQQARMGQQAMPGYQFPTPFSLGLGQPGAMQPGMLPQMNTGHFPTHAAGMPMPMQGNAYGSPLPPHLLNITVGRMHPSMATAPGQAPPGMWNPMMTPSIPGMMPSRSSTPQPGAFGV